MEDYRDRLRCYLDSISVTPTYFVDNLGFSNGLINNVLKKARHLGTDKIEYILNHFDDLNARWLFTGKGEMSWTKEAIGHSQVIGTTNALANSLTEVGGTEMQLKKQVEDLRYTIEVQRDLIEELKDQRQQTKAVLVLLVYNGRDN